MHGRGEKKNRRIESMGVYIYRSMNGVFFLFGKLVRKYTLHGSVIGYVWCMSGESSTTWDD